MPHRVLIADNHSATRAGMAALVNAATDLTVCGSTIVDRTTVDVVRHAAPEVVVVDVPYGRPARFALVGALLALRPFVHVVLVSMGDQPDLVERACHAGASHVLKFDASCDLVPAIRRAAGAA